jgi:hypothetical protein
MVAGEQLNPTTASSCSSMVDWTPTHRAVHDHERTTGAGMDGAAPTVARAGSPTVTPTVGWQVRQPSAATARAHSSSSPSDSGSKSRGSMANRRCLTSPSRRHDMPGTPSSALHCAHRPGPLILVTMRSASGGRSGVPEVIMRLWRRSDHSERGTHAPDPDKCEHAWRPRDVSLALPGPYVCEVCDHCGTLRLHGPEEITGPATRVADAAATHLESLEPRRSPRHASPPPPPD